MTAQDRAARLISLVEADAVSLKLFLIARELKPGLSRSASVFEKYLYRAFMVDISQSLASHFSKNAINALNRIVNDTECQLSPYSVIGDDLGNLIYTCTPNPHLSFTDMYGTQIFTENCDYLSNLNEVKNSLWAYSVRFSSQLGAAYSFRKISKSKVAVDQRNKVLAIFDLDSSLLTELDKNVISFDDKIDFLLVDNEFIILHKPGFEQVVGLEDEFYQAASNLINELSQTGLIDGLEFFNSAISKNRTILKAVSHIAKTRSYDNFDKNEILRMSNVLRQFEDRDLRQSNQGNVLLETPSDIKDFIRLLSDYYKQGMVSGRYYGSLGGHIVKPVASQ
jgi:hypothetical protein